MENNTPAHAKSIAYLRVSSEEQCLEKNKFEILQFANEQALGTVHFIEEKVSGKTPWRHRKLAGILDELAAGDHLVVSELSRLGRSMLECMEVLSITTAKGIHVYALKGNWKLDDSIQSKIVAMAFSMAAEYCISFRIILRSSPLGRSSFLCTGTVVILPSGCFIRKCEPLIRTTSKPSCSRIETKSFPDIIGNTAIYAVTSSSRKPTKRFS